MRKKVFSGLMDSCAGMIKVYVCMCVWSIKTHSLNKNPKFIFLDVSKVYSIILQVEKYYQYICINRINTL